MRATHPTLTVAAESKLIALASHCSRRYGTRSWCRRYWQLERSSLTSCRCSPEKWERNPREYSGGRVEVGRRCVGAPVDGEGAPTVILICNRQIIGRTGVGASRNVVHTLRATRGIHPVVERSRVPAVVCAAAELPAVIRSARTVAQARHVEGGSCILSHTACDTTRAVLQVVQCVVVVGQRVSAARKQRRAAAVVNRGGWVVVGARAVSAPALGASATVGVGTLVEV